MANPELVWHHQAHDCSIASFGNVIVNLLHTTMSVEALRASLAVNRKLSRESGYVAVLTMLEPSVQMPTPEVRKAAADAMAEARPTTRVEVRVLPGDGFWASAQRGIITAIDMVRPDSVPRRTFRHLREGTHFIAQHLDKDAKFALALEQATLRALEKRAHERTAAARPA
jgi:hypothetical protein